MRNFNENSGTFQGDPNGVWLSTNISINNTSLIASGTLSYYGVITPLNSSLTLPSPNVSTVTYISLQVNNAGALTLYTSITSAPTLQPSNILEIYSDIVPINASSDEIISTDGEPILD
jgi:hypothetical protein